MATWAVASTTAAARSSSVAKGLTADKVTLEFLPSDELKYLTYRLHELCFNLSKKGSITAPKWEGEGSPKRGTELAHVILEALRQQLGDKINKVDVDAHRVSQDIEEMLEKSAKEYVKLIQ
jgi:hypothetical protein